MITAVARRTAACGAGGALTMDDAPYNGDDQYHVPSNGGTNVPRRFHCHDDADNVLLTGDCH